MVEIFKHETRKRNLFSIIKVYIVSFFQSILDCISSSKASKANKFNKDDVKSTPSTLSVEESRAQNYAQVPSKTPPSKNSSIRSNGVKNEEIESLKSVVSSKKRKSSENQPAKGRELSSTRSSGSKKSETSENRNQIINNSKSTEFTFFLKIILRKFGFFEEKKRTSTTSSSQTSMNANLPSVSSKKQSNVVMETNQIIKQNKRASKDSEKISHSTSTNKLPSSNQQLSKSFFESLKVKTKSLINKSVAFFRCLVEKIQLIFSIRRLPRRVVHNTFEIYDVSFERQTRKVYFCDCGKQKLYFNSKTNLEEIYRKGKVEDHRCVFSCPWVLEGCCFESFKENFEHHFKTSCEFDQIFQKTNPKKNQKNVSPNDDNKVQKQAGDIQCNKKSSEEFNSVQQINSKPVKTIKCCDHPRGVVGCTIMISSDEIFTHLEDPNYLKSHLNLILD